MAAVTEMKNYTIHSLGVEDTQEVIDFLRKYHYPDEPVCKALGIIDSPEQDYYITHRLGDGCSFKAVNEAGEMIAIKINGFTHRGDKLEIEVHDEKTAIGLQFVLHVLYELEIFSFVESNVDRMIEGKVTTVRPDYRGQGLANAFFEKTVEWMEANGIKYMVTMCSSHYTALACKRMGFKEVFALNYADYKVDGVCPIVPELPHTRVAKYLTTVDI